MGRDTDGDPHGRSALETGPSAGRGCEQEQARRPHSDPRDLTVQRMHSSSKNGQTRRGLAVSMKVGLGAICFKPLILQMRKQGQSREDAATWAHSEPLVQPGWDLRGKPRTEER